jgi:hypothetical protein
MTGEIASSIGLLLDIVGVILVFQYGLPDDISRGGHTYRIIEQTDEAEIAKGKHYDRMGRIGLILLIGGFALQLASNWL